MAAVALATDAAPHKLRVGVFADLALQPRWVVEALAKVAAGGFAQIVYLGIGSAAGPEPEPWPWRVYGALDRRLFPAGEDPEAPLELARFVAHARRGALDADLAGVDLDVAFALGAVDERRLEGLARYGVWRFRADGLREVVEQAPLTGSALLARLPGAEPRIAYQSWSRTDPRSLTRNRARLLRKTSHFAWRALRELSRSGAAWLEQCRLLREAPAGDARRELSPLALAPRLARRILRRGVEKALRIEHWFLAFRFGGGPQTRMIAPDLAGFTRIVPPRDRIWADPFPIERNGRYFVFFEEAPVATGKGHIAMIEITPQGRWSEPVRVLERDHHLSYPFVLEHEGELYLVPETGEKRTVEAWRCVDFPRRWRLERTLLEGVRLVDATLHRHAERWWMFANGACEGWSVNDELHLFHAERFLGEWRPHERNPVKSDVRGARPAGRLYWHNGALYRPAQICAPDYGSGLALHRVLRLTPHEYAERQVERMLPGAGLLGLHTVNCAGELTVVDAWTRRSRFGGYGGKISSPRSG